MEAVAIALLVFIFVVLALTVLITLLYKGGSCDNNLGSHHKYIYRKSKMVGQMGSHMENGVSLSADNGIANTAAAVVFVVGNTEGGGGDGGDAGG
ncbi:hypothetical protein Tco_0272167 [Tanacetum coccineum]